MTAKTEKDEELTEEQLEELGRQVPFYLSWRIYIAIIAFFGFINIYAQRVCMSVAIVCMVNQTAVKMLTLEDEPANRPQVLMNMTNMTTYDAVTAHPNFTSQNSEQVCVSSASNGDASGEGEFVWSKGIQGQVLSSFFYGYIVSQIPGGLLAERFGAKRVMLVFMFVATVGTVLSPIAAQVNYIFLIVVRVIVGLASGVVYPATHAMWSQWAPPLERSKLAGFTYAGGWFGMVVGFPISGLLCKYGFAGGWPSVFYVTAIVSFVWLALWAFLVSDNPGNHPRIKTAERDYIVKSLKGQVSADSGKTNSIPWLKFLTSMPVWAIIVANITTDWGLYTFLTNIPTYMAEVLKFDIQSNGLLSSLPFIGMWINMTICPALVDKFRASGKLSTTLARKLMMAIGSFGAAIFLIALGFIDCTRPAAAVALLSLGVTVSGCVYSGFLVNHMDIAPKYAGTLFGISNCIACITGFLAPATAAALTPNGSQAEWQRVFFVAAAIYAFGAIFYLIFGTGVLQEWGRDATSEEAVEMDPSSEKLNKEKEVAA